MLFNQRVVCQCILLHLIILFLDGVSDYLKYILLEHSDESSVNIKLLIQFLQQYLSVSNNIIEFKLPCLGYWYQHL